MRDQELFYRIANETLGTFCYRQSYAPGMFEPLKPLLEELFDTAVIYIADDFPEDMHVAMSYGDRTLFPDYVSKMSGKTLAESLAEVAEGIPNIMVGQLFNHGRELGAVAVVCRDKSKATRTAFEYLLKFMSVMAYIERIRTNSNRERQERDVFFAQSLTNRMVMREPPKVRGLRLGFEFIRNLDTSGDFFDFIPNRDGGLYGYIGCCSGKGLRTVLEVMSIMRRLSRDLVRTGDLVYIIMSVNDYLVNDKKRAHQASLCLFEVDPERQKLRVVKAGKLGILLFAGKSATHNLSTHSGMFLGMIPKPKIVVEEADFPNGSSLFCVTEGFYNSVSFLNAPPSVQWFMRALEDTVADRNTVPLANAVFQRVNQTIDYGNRPVESMVAISVESRKRNSISVARNR